MQNRSRAKRSCGGRCVGIESIDKFAQSAFWYPNQSHDALQVKSKETV